LAVLGLGSGTEMIGSVRRGAGRIEVKSALELMSLSWGSTSAYILAAAGLGVMGVESLFGSCMSPSL
jgi:hypothetical protein